MGIQNCRHKGLEELFIDGKTAKIGKSYHKNIIMILDHLANIANIKDCMGVKDFHERKGARKGTYSMHISGNYCITFQWENGNVIDVDFEDYHRK